MSTKNDIKARLSGNKPGIDAEAIRALSDLLAETGLTEIEIEQNGARIRVARAGDSGRHCRRAGQRRAGACRRAGARLRPARRPAP